MPSEVLLFSVIVSSILTMELHTELWPLSRCPGICACSDRRNRVNSTSRKYVVCNHENIMQVADVIPHDAEVLEIINSKVRSIDNLSYLLHRGRLESLYLRGNEIRNIDVLKRAGNTVTMVDLSANCIQKLSAVVAKNARNLQFLNFSRNNIEIIHPYSLLSNIYLATLDLSFNKLSAPKCRIFHRLKRLQFLSLRGNKITAVRRQCFFGLDNLETLDLSENNIHKITHTAFSSVGQLKLLYLQSNRLRAVPTEELQNFKNLELLDLSNNLFKTITSHDFYDINVTCLYINHERYLITVERLSFEDLQHLKILQIRNNSQLSFIDPNAFMNLTSLTELDLSNNRLETVSMNMIVNSHSMVTLFVAGNPLRCDCNIRWLMNYYKRQTDVDDVEHDLNNSECIKPKVISVLDVQAEELSLTANLTCKPTIVRNMLRHLYELFVGEKLHLQCRAYGATVTRGRWFKGTTPCSDSSEFVDIGVEDIVKVRVELFDAGFYKCKVFNEMAQDSVCVRVIVKENSASFVVYEITETTVSITWLGLERYKQYKTLILRANQHHSYAADNTISIYSTCDELYTRSNHSLNSERSFSIIASCHINRNSTNMTIKRLHVSETIKLCITFVDDILNEYANCELISTLSPRVNVGIDQQNRALVFAAVIGLFFLTSLIVASLYHVQRMTVNAVYHNIGSAMPADTMIV